MPELPKPSAPEPEPATIDLTGMDFAFAEVKTPDVEEDTGLKIGTRLLYFGRWSPGLLEWGRNTDDTFYACAMCMKQNYLGAKFREDAQDAGLEHSDDTVGIINPDTKLNELKEKLESFGAVHNEDLQKKADEFYLYRPEDFEFGIGWLDEGVVMIPMKLIVEDYLYDQYCRVWDIYAYAPGVDNLIEACESILEWDYRLRRAGDVRTTPQGTINHLKAYGYKHTHRMQDEYTGESFEGSAWDMSTGTEIPINGGIL